MLQNEQMKSQTLIIDCRFDYEYKGGHIKEAINIDNPIELVNFLYNHYDLFSIQFISFVKQLHEHLLQYSNKPKHIDYRQLYKQFVLNEKKNLTTAQINERDIFLIFHCEFSKERSPKMMKFIQKQDQQNNRFPNMYLLVGGYDQFVSEFGSLCIPQDGYVSMFNKKMEEHKINSQKEYNHNWNLAKLPIRSQSFNFI